MLLLFNQTKEGLKQMLQRHSGIALGCFYDDKHAEAALNCLCGRVRSKHSCSERHDPDTDLWSLRSLKQKLMYRRGDCPDSLLMWLISKEVCFLHDTKELFFVDLTIAITISLI
jgi:hypothetical protein